MRLLIPGLTFASVASVVASLGIGTAAFAFPQFPGELESHYKEQRIDISKIIETYACQTCHVAARPRSNPERNPFGKDVEKTLSDAGLEFSAFELLDSDTDGFDNLEEFYLQTAPGLKTEAPKGRLLLKQDATLATLLKLEFPAQSKCASADVRVLGGSKAKFEGEFSDEFSFAPKNTEPLVLTLNAKPAAGSVVLIKCEAEGLVGKLKF